MSLLPSERETVIGFDDESKVALITTYSRPIITKLKKNPGATLIKEWKFEGTAGAEFTLPAELVSFRAPRAKKTLTAKQQADLKARGQALGKSRRKNG